MWPWGWEANTGLWGVRAQARPPRGAVLPPGVRPWRGSGGVRGPGLTPHSAQRGFTVGAEGLRAPQTVPACSCSEPAPGPRGRREGAPRVTAGAGEGDRPEGHGDPVLAAGSPLSCEGCSLVCVCLLEAPSQTLGLSHGLRSPDQAHRPEGGAAPHSACGAPLTPWWAPGPWLPIGYWTSPRESAVRCGTWRAPDTFLSVLPGMLAPHSWGPRG